MWYLPVLVVLVAAGGYAGLVRMRKGNEPSRGWTTVPSPGSLSDMELELLLARLENEPAPEPVMGAMCYSPMAIPDSAEYLCPVCGEKTVYHGGLYPFLQWELDLSRRLASSIDAATEMTVQLDETMFCPFCSGQEGMDPHLVLRVTRNNGEVLENAVTVTDLRMLESFIAGNLHWTTSNEGQQPLRDHAERLAVLLGISEPHGE